MRASGEETGLACRAVQLLALFDKLEHPHPPQLPMPTGLLPVRGDGRLCYRPDETKGAGYFPIDALPGTLPPPGGSVPVSTSMTIFYKGGGIPCSINRFAPDTAAKEAA